MPLSLRLALSHATLELQAVATLLQRTPEDVNLQTALNVAALNWRLCQLERRINGKLAHA